MAKRLIEADDEKVGAIRALLGTRTLRAELIAEVTGQPTEWVVPAGSVP